MAKRKKQRRKSLNTKQFKVKFDEYMMVDSIVAAETILKNMKEAGARHCVNRLTHSQCHRDKFVSFMRVNSKFKEGDAL